MPRRKKQADGGAGGGDGGAPTQMAAVRQSLQELGYDAETQRLHDHIASKYGMEIANNKISSYKSTIRKQAGFKSSRGRKAGGRPAGGGHGAAAHAGIVEDVRVVKELTDRLGANRLRELIDVLSR